MSLSEHNVGQQEGQIERKPSQVDVALEVMAKEVAAIHVVVDQLHERLKPVRIPGQYPETEADERPPRSPLIGRLHELADALLGQRQRLEQLSEEIQL